ncbi:UNVERIFIED_CONTAM: hypothetical protein Slati_3046400 [Sesamum latifolium]|uniref:Retrotransposon gag domain-containing protein n=1 Tax=Sesamum latifolium TaxID=2727402 RepID=A0AAW2US87_9LAMI
MELLGQPQDPYKVLFPQVETLCLRVETLQKLVDDLPSFTEGWVVLWSNDVSILTHAIDIKSDGMKTGVNLLKRVVGKEDDRVPLSKVKVPDLKPFGGARSAKEFENFLWDMETYFHDGRILDAEKLSITSMYLIGDVKLWWRTRLSEDANRDKIETWDVLKKD